MGIAIPQVVTEDRASSALSVDGSLRFNGSNQYLRKAFGTEGNRQVFTWSCWVKRNEIDTWQRIFACEPSSNNIGGLSWKDADSRIRLQQQDNAGAQGNNHLLTVPYYRDISGFYHVVMAVDTVNATAADRFKIYINGERQSNTWDTGGNPAQLSKLFFNSTSNYHEIGHSTQYNAYHKGQMAQCYWIDGLQLEPSEFGFTDPLTNTWRPKKYTGAFSGSLTSVPTSTSNVAPSGGYGNTTPAATLLFGMPGPTSATSHIRQDGGGIEWSPAITLSNDVAGAECVYLNNTSAHNIEFKINGSWVTAQTTANTPIGTTAYGALITLTTSGSWTGVRATGGSNISVTGVTGIFVNGVRQYNTSSNNGFYLPMDGSAPVGEDQSGNGNDFTPIFFGGSAALDKATGALPILNTASGGSVARSGVLGSDVSNKFTVTTATVDSATRYALNGVDRPNPTLYRGGTYTFDYTAASSHPLYLSSLQNGKWNSKAYSVSFDGTGDALRVADHADLRFGTGAFTVECYVWFNSFDDNYPSIISKYTGGTASWIMRVKNDGKAIFYTAVGGGTNNESSVGIISLNRWHHIAMVREGTGSNQAKMYVDGKLVVTATDNTDYVDTQEITIGAQNASDSNVLNGYMSNVRIIKGTALYTSEFTPPGTTLTNVTGTKLLCCQDSDATTAAVIPSGSITVAGNPAATRSKQPFLYDNNHGNFGLNLATSNTTKITIPHLAGDSLYYYCNQHPNMGNTTAMSVVTDIEKADPYAWKCTLALPCIGDANDVSYLINCNATELPIVPQANAHADFSVGNFYGGSYDLDGTGDYINVNSSSPYSHVNFGYGDYTAECWVYLDGTGDEYVFNMSTNHGGAAPHWNINFYGSNLIRAGRTNSSGDSRHQITYSFATNRWMHIAISRGGGTSRLFLDGVLIDTQSDDDGIAPTGNLNIGAYNNGGNELNGFVQDARIYNGVAKYTSSFIPASADPNILPDSPSGIVTKTKLKKITDGAVAFDGSGDYLVAGNNSDLAVGSGDFTLECFVYRDDSVSAFTNFIATRGSAGSANGYTFGAQASSNGYDVEFYTNAMTGINGGNQKITPNRWHHVVLTRSGTTLRSFVNGVLNTTTTNSQDFSNTSMAIGMTNDGSQGPMNGYLSNVRVIKGSIPTEYQTSSTTVDTKIFTPPNRALTTTSQGATASEVKLLCGQSNILSASVAPLISGVNSGTVWSDSVVLGSVFRSGFPAADAFNGVSKSSTNDCAAVDLIQNGFVEFTFGGGVPFTTLQMQCDDNNSGTVVVNGVDITSQLPTGSLTNTTITGITSPLTSLRLTKTTSDASSVYLGSVTIDGTMLRDSLTPNGDVTATNFNPFNTDIDTVRGQESNYCTWNPLTMSRGNLLEGNLLFYGNGTNTPRINGTISKTSGKWYYEVTVLNDGPGTGSGDVHNSIGWGLDSVSTIETAPNTSAMDHSFYFMDSGYYKNFSGSNTNSSTGKWLAGDVIGVAADLDNNTLTFFKNNIQVLSATIGTTAGTPLCPAHQSNTGNYGRSVANFGQKPFKFPPPDGYQPLSASTVRPDNVIVRPDQYVGVTTYVGDTNSSQDINVGFAPDLVWQKIYSQAGDNALTDTVRGVNAGYLQSEDADKEKGNANDGISAFLSNGFRAYNSFNNNGLKWVSWCWKAGGSGSDPFYIDDVGYATAAAAGLDNGSEITPTGASIGTKQGFSIITYTATNGNTTVTHGLTQKPDFAIFKNRDSTLGINEVDWGVYHSGIGALSALELNQTLTKQTYGGPFNNTEPTSTKFTLGTGGHSYLTNGPSGEKFVAYIWHNVPGLQKFGVYDGTGLGGTTPFIELGFRPALVWLKSFEGSTSNWVILDDKRPGYNSANLQTLCANLNNGHNASGGTSNDILSNGFKIRGSSDRNASNTKYIYCAWAASPFSNLYGAQSNAE